MIKATSRRGRPRDHRHRRGNSTIRSLLTMTTTTSRSTLPLLLMQLLSFGIYLHPLVSSPVPSSQPPPPAASSSSGGMSGEGSPTTTARRSGGGWVLITDPRPQLDEIHLTSDDNRDVNPPPPPGGGHPWTDAWYNDYWGRPLDSTSSHKSWRPLSVWSFRFGGGGTVGRRAIGQLAGAVASMMALTSAFSALAA